MLNKVNIIININCFLILCLFTFSVSSQTLRVGLIDFPPHLSFDEELTNSPLYQYVNKILDSLNYTVEYVKLPSERAYLELTKGQLDILLPISLPANKDEVSTPFTPIFHSVPGLCFKKENFIPILSATHRFDDLTIGIPAASSPVLALTNSEAKLIPIKGENATSRGIELTQRGRFDAFYHPSPIKVYHRNSPLYKEVACSYFHGYSTPMHIAVANKLSKQTTEIIHRAFETAMKNQSYEFYFASRK